MPVMYYDIWGSSNWKSAGYFNKFNSDDLKGGHLDVQVADCPSMSLFFDAYETGTHSSTIARLSYAMLGLENVDSRVIYSIPIASGSSIDCISSPFNGTIIVQKGIPPYTFAYPYQTANGTESAYRYKWMILKWRPTQEQLDAKKNTAFNVSYTPHWYKDSKLQEPGKLTKEVTIFPYIFSALSCTSYGFTSYYNDCNVKIPFAIKTPAQANNDAEGYFMLVNENKKDAVSGYRTSISASDADKTFYLKLQSVDLDNSHYDNPQYGLSKSQSFVVYSMLKISDVTDSGRQ
jgi:hypothetical protein